MRATVVEFRPLVGLGIQRILNRIADVDDSSVITPRPETPCSLHGTELLVLGALPRGANIDMHQLLETASAVRCVLFLAHGGEVQWMPPNPFAPLLSWLPEHASAVEIECALRALIACAQAGIHALEPTLPIAPATPIAVPTPVGVHGSTRVPAYICEARLLRLTLRQYEVLVLLSRGLSVKSISRQLRISVPTVKSHTLQLYRRLAAKNKSEAVFMAREKGAALATVSSDP